MGPKRRASYPSNTTIEDLIDPERFGWLPRSFKLGSIGLCSKVKWAIIVYSAPACSESAACTPGCSAGSVRPSSATELRHLAGSWSCTFDLIYIGRRLGHSTAAWSSTFWSLGRWKIAWSTQAAALHFAWFVALWILALSGWRSPTTHSTFSAILRLELASQVAAPIAAAG